MLILIAGITGMCGQACAKVALEKGHQVRGMGRSLDKLDKDLSSKLESFVQIKDMYDIAALDQAVKGVDAVISALTYQPDIVIAGQLALLLAADRAGVKIFHAASWNYDWSKLQLGEHESYDAYICFKRMAELCSTIKPIYGFTGGILEYQFMFSDRPNPIDKAARTVSYFGDGTEVHRYVTSRNLAEYSLAAITEPNAADGGFYYVESMHFTMLEMGRIYGEARGIHMEPIRIGGQDMVEGLVDKSRQETALNDFEKYIGLVYVKFINNGKYDYEPIDSKRWAAQVKQTSLKEWLEEHPDL